MQQIKNFIKYLNYKKIFKKIKNNNKISSSLSSNNTKQKKKIYKRKITKM